MMKYMPLVIPKIEGGLTRDGKDPYERSDEID